MQTISDQSPGTDMFLSVHPVRTTPCRYPMQPILSDVEIPEQKDFQEFLPKDSLLPLVSSPASNRAHRNRQGGKLPSGRTSRPGLNGRYINPSSITHRLLTKTKHRRPRSRRNMLRRIRPFLDGSHHPVLERRHPTRREKRSQQNKSEVAAILAISIFGII